MEYSLLQQLLGPWPGCLDGDHFVLYHMLSDTKRFSANQHSANRRALLLVYLRSLESLWHTMSGQPFERMPPLVGSKKKTVVHVLDFGLPFTFEDQSDPAQPPHIVLRSSIREPTLEGRLARAEAEAVHEATHAFNHRHRPYHKTGTNMVTGLWRWFDEGTAMYMEMRVLPGVLDHYRFLGDWIAEPDIPLDAISAEYQTGMFVFYLVNRMGPAFISKVWEEAKPQESPLEAIERLSGERSVDILTDYFREAYFLCDPTRSMFFPEMYARFGGRVPAVSWILADGKMVGTEEEQSLDHLSCRYYRLDLSGDVETLRVKVLCSAVTDARGGVLRAELVTVTPDGRQGVSKLLLPKVSSGVMELSAELRDIDPQAVDHAIVVISNIGTQVRANPREPHDDDQRYHVKGGTVMTDDEERAGYMTLGTTEPICLPSDANSRVAVPGESYFCLTVHSAQAAFTGPFWERALQLVVTSQVDLSQTLLGPGPCRAIQRSRRVVRNRAIKLGLRSNLINWAPAVMDHVSVSIDFHVDTENRLALLVNLINDDAFVAAVSLAPGAAAVARTISGLSQKILHTLMGEKNREPILQFSGDFNILGGDLREGYYAILGTYDTDHPIPRPLPLLSIQDGDLLANGSPVTDWSYVVLEVRLIDARTRALSDGALWELKLRQAEASARQLENNPLATDSERHRIWDEELKLLQEAQILLLAEPSYLSREADDIIREAYHNCYTSVFGTMLEQVRLRPMQGLGWPRVDAASDRALLGIAPEEDLNVRAAQYAARVVESRRIMAEANLYE